MIRTDERFAEVFSVILLRHAWSIAQWGKLKRPLDLSLVRLASMEETGPEPFYDKLESWEINFR